MKLIKMLPIINIILLIGILTYILYSTFNLSNKKQYVYIDNIKLFNGFHMSKDLSKIHKKKITEQTKIVDSLYQLFQMDIKAKKDEDVLRVSQQRLQSQDAELKKMQQYYTTEISQQIWDRLNIYILDYGKLHSSKIIFGTQGAGNIMYADDLVDETENVLQFANTKYEGE